MASKARHQETRGAREGPCVEETSEEGTAVWNTDVAEEGIEQGSG